MAGHIAVELIAGSVTTIPGSFLEVLIDATVESGVHGVDGDGSGQEECEELHCFGLVLVEVAVSGGVPKEVVYMED